MPDNERDGCGTALGEAIERVRDAMAGAGYGVIKRADLLAVCAAAEQQNRWNIARARLESGLGEGFDPGAARATAAQPKGK